MVLIGSTTIATNGSWNIAFIFSVLGTLKTIFRPGSFGWASVWKHQFPRANIRNQGESDTNQWHSRGDQPKSSMSTRFKYSSYLFGRLNVGSHVLVTLRLSIHPGLCSFHWQGKGVHHHHDISVHLKLKLNWREEKNKQTFPNSSPMISRLPPDLACITIFSRAKAEILMSYKCKLQGNLVNGESHLKEVRVLFPWLCCQKALLLLSVVFVNLISSAHLQREGHTPNRCCHWQSFFTSMMLLDISQVFWAMVTWLAPAAAISAAYSVFGLFSESANLDGYSESPIPHSHM